MKTENCSNCGQEKRVDINPCRFCHGLPLSPKHSKGQCPVCGNTERNKDGYCVYCVWRGWAGAGAMLTPGNNNNNNNPLERKQAEERGALFREKLSAAYADWCEEHPESTQDDRKVAYQNIYDIIHREVSNINQQKGQLK